MKNSALLVMDLQNDITKHYKEIIEAVNTAIDWAVRADAAACIKSTCYNMAKSGYTVHVLSDCITSCDKKKLPELLGYYESKGCTLLPLADAMRA